jgi:uncharacterized protein (DUF1778 family)
MMRVKLTPDELAMIDEAADKEDETRSQFVRSAVLAMARKVLKSRVR